MSDSNLIDWMSAGEVYIQLDEPDSYISREDDGHQDGPWKVGIAKTHAGKVSGYRITRCKTLRDALTILVHGFVVA